MYIFSLYLSLQYFWEEQWRSSIHYSLNFIRLEKQTVNQNRLSFIRFLDCEICALIIISLLNKYNRRSFPFHAVFISSKRDWRWQNVSTAHVLSSRRGPALLCFESHFADKGLVRERKKVYVQWCGFTGTTHFILPGYTGKPLNIVSTN